MASKSEISHAEYKAAADACYKSGDYRGAISHYTLAIESAADLQQPDENAAADANASLATPAPPVARRTLAAYHSNRAAAATMLLRHDDALADCESAIELDPTFVKARVRQARVLTTLGRWREASTAYGRAMVYDSNDAVLVKAGEEVKTLQRRFDLVGVLLDGGAGKNSAKEYPYLSMPPAKDSKQALNQINLILESSPEAKELLLYKLRALVYLSKVQEAYALSTSLIRRSGAASGPSQPAAASQGEQDSLLLLLRAHCLYCMGNLDDAVRHVRQILSGDPDSKDAFVMHKLFKTLGQKKAAADAAYKSRQFADSVALYTEALVASPGGDPEATGGGGGGLYRAKLLFNRASAAANLQRHTSVVADCTRALRLDDGYVKAYTRRAASRLALADAAADADDRTGAEQLCREALRDYERAGELTSAEGPHPDKATHGDIKKRVRAAQVQLKRAGQRDLYRILEVRRGAPDAEIKKCYRKKAMKWHPDRHAGGTEEERAAAEKVFRDVNLAYEVLSDREKRARYDSGVDAQDVDNPEARPGGACGGCSGAGGIDPQVLFQMFMQQQQQQQGGFQF